MIGDIRYAWSDEGMAGIGSVRIAVTDQQTFVIAAGKSSLLPSLQAYREWESTLTAVPHLRFTSGPWQPATEPILWAFDNTAIAEVRVSRLVGIGIQKGLSGVYMWVRSAGVRRCPPTMNPSFGEWLHFIWRVPGQPEDVRAFFLQLPFGSVVVPK